MTMAQVHELVSRSIARRYHEDVLRDFEGAGLPMPGAVDVHIVIDQLVDLTWRDFRGYAEVAIEQISFLAKVERP